MKKVIIHGHFYQPPRENPWTGIIEEQKEAAPYSNWNQRISRECYEANAYSPLLDGKGRTERFFNNYEHISFNAGPTLLSWLEQEMPHVYDKILEGDRLSLKTRGEGNAIAQVYNHIILPLASERDRRTQIIWSLEDFRKRFSRDSRGLWLSETAISPSTVEEMVRNGIEYTILSPHQAERFQFSPHRSEPVEDPEELWRHCWTLDCPSGELKVFFYHPGLSAGISFNHLLRDADHLYAVIRSEMEKSDLLSVATDGEIYGHHETLGNMGLSALLAKIEADPEMETVNFSQLCNELSPAGRISLNRGEDGKGSSWSCSHGVSRWYKDCGCSTGAGEGWNQKWRTPLRDALEGLNLRAEKIFKEEMTKLTDRPDPDGVRNDYIRVLNGSVSQSGFLATLNVKTEGGRMEFLRLLEGQKYAMYMFTSCAWFFADITGVEPRQNLLYAAKLLELYKTYLPPEAENEFRNKLTEARSNLNEEDSAVDVFEKDISRMQEGLFRGIAVLILAEYYKLPGIKRGELDAEGPVAFNKSEENGTVLAKGSAKFKERYSGILHSASFTIREDRISFSDMGINMDGQNRSYSLKDFSPREQKALLSQFTSNNRRPDPAAFPRLLKRFNAGSDSIRAAAHSALWELLILMKGGDTRSWTSFRTLLAMDLLKRIPLPAEAAERFYTAVEQALSVRDKKQLQAIRRQILSTLPFLTLPEDFDEMPASLAGRLYDLYRNSGEGSELIRNMNEEGLNRLRRLLRLSPSIPL